jgi:hypothetical protein
LFECYQSIVKNISVDLGSAGAAALQLRSQARQATSSTKKCANTKEKIAHNQKAATASSSRLYKLKEVDVPNQDIISYAVCAWDLRPSSGNWAVCPELNSARAAVNLHDFHRLCSGVDWS